MQRFGYGWAGGSGDLCGAINKENVMKIVVSGSLGNISKPLTEALVQQGHQLIVISSKADRQAAIEALGATAAIGSLGDANFLTETFTGADAVYAMIPSDFTATDQVAHYEAIGRSYLQAIQQSGVKRVVHLSSWGAHLERGTGFIVGSHRVEQMLNTLTDVAVTHLRAGYIYYNLLRFVDMIKGQGRIVANYGDNDRIVMVAPADIAAMAAEELQTPASVGSQVRYAASDDQPVTEITKVLGAAIGKPDLQWVRLSDEQMQSGMTQRGVPPHFIKNSLELGHSIHNGALREDYELHPPQPMGRVKLEDFANEFAAAFRKG